MASFVLRDIDPALWKAARKKAGSTRYLLILIESFLHGWVGTVDAVDPADGVVTK